MRNLFVFLIGYSRTLVIISALASVLTGLCNTAFVALVNEAVSDINSRPDTMYYAFIALFILLPISRVTATMLLANLSQQAIMDLRMHLSRGILSAPLRKLEKLGANKLLASLTDDVLKLSQTLTDVPGFWMNLTIVLSCIGYMFFLNALATVLVFSSIFLGIIMYRIVGSRAFRYQGAAREEQDALHKHFRALTDGNKELKLHRERKKAFMSQLLGFTAASYRRNNLIANAYFAIGGTAGQMIIFTVIGLLVLFLPGFFSDVTNKEIVGFTLVILFMMGPLDRLTSIIPNISDAVISLNKIQGLGITLGKMTSEAEDTPEPKATWKSIELAGVTHAYHREKEDQVFTLGPINCTIKPGELIFLIGGNGSGKTTLGKLLLGLYTPDKGDIRLDGVPITDANRETYRQYFTAVFSDFFLFDTLLGLEGDLDEKTREYLVRLQLDHKVKIQDGKLSTTNLSQGQRKRLALLTAYLEDRPIYLFDEWAADQDPLFKEVFYHTLLPNLRERGKTIIVISHDDHYFHIADRIIKMDYGQLETDKSLKGGANTRKTTVT